MVSIKHWSYYVNVYALFKYSPFIPFPELYIVPNRGFIYVSVSYCWITNNHILWHAVVSIDSFGSIGWLGFG